MVVTYIGTGIIGVALLSKSTWSTESFVEGSTNLIDITLHI